MSAASSAALPALRHMRPADVPAVARLERESYEFPWTESIFRDCLRVGYMCRVLEYERATAGYGILAHAAGEAHLLNFCISTGLRRLGFGSFFLRHLVSDAQRLACRRMFLEVRPTNRGALRLYMKHGFRRIGLRKRYYRAATGREDALVLALDLRGASAGDLQE